MDKLLSVMRRISIDSSIFKGRNQTGLEYSMNVIWVLHDNDACLEIWRKFWINTFTTHGWRFLGKVMEMHVLDADACSTTKWGPLESISRLGFESLLERSRVSYPSPAQTNATLSTHSPKINVSQIIMECMSCPRLHCDSPREFLDMHQIRSSEDTQM